MNDTTWRIYTLGSLQAQSEHQTLNHLSMRRAGALLACLVMRAPHPVSREELLTLLWPEEATATAQNRFRVLLNALRQQLEPGATSPGSVLAAGRYTVSLVPTAFTSDYHDFLSALQAAKSTPEASDAIVCLERAATLYRGELLPGFYDEWVLAERRHLADRHYQTLRELARRLKRQGATERALEYARRAVASEPLDEEAHCDLIALYGETGQPSAGLRQYGQLKRLMHEEMQVQPSTQAQQLAATLETLLGHGMTQPKRTLRPLNLRDSEQEKTERNGANRLPPRLTRFFGRREESDYLRALLAPDGDARLVSLLGPGGSGKTRLAIEIAEQMQEAYAGRVFFAPLADTTEPNHIGIILAKALRLPSTPGLNPLAQAMAVLNQAPSLLVLDNLEHLLPEAAPQIEHLLWEVDSLRCLLTSRRSAGIEGEQEIALKPLPCPAAGESVDTLANSPVVALFVDRARLVRSDFALTPTNAEDVARLCRTLEGLPLAIELAAARARVSTPAEMRKQTGKLLNWLVDARGGKNARHRSLRATLEWSYRLLTLEERAFFNALSVFVGGFSLAAAHFVGQSAGGALSETEALLERLSAASLLTMGETEDESTRFTMLETLREFGQERLAAAGTERQTRAKHLACFAQIVREETELASSSEKPAASVLTCENGNLREALEFGLRGDASAEEMRLGLNLAHGLASFWETQGFWNEGRDYLRRASQLPLLAEKFTTKVDLFQSAGVLSNLLADYAEARRLSEEGLTLAEALGYVQGVAGCLSNLGNVAFYEDDYAVAEERLAHALQLYRQEGEAVKSAACLVSLGNVAFYLGNHPAAQARLQEALAIYRRRGDSRGIAFALLRLGNVRRNQGFFGEGRTLISEALALFRQLGDRHGIASCLHDLGLLAYILTDGEEARARYAEALALFQAIGSRRGLNACLFKLGNLAQDQGDYGEARARYEEVLSIYRKIGDRRNIAACLASLGDLSVEQEHLSEALAHFQEALRIEQDIDSRGGIANCLAGLGRLALAQEAWTEARLRLNDALEIYREMNAQQGIAVTLEAHARLKWHTGHVACAARLMGAAATLRQELGYFRYFTPRVHTNVLNALRAAMGETAFTEAWQRGQALSISEAIIETLQSTVQGIPGV